MNSSPSITSPRWPTNWPPDSFRAGPVALTVLAAVGVAVPILIAGLVLALTFVGGEDAQIAMHLSGDMTLAFQGVLLSCVLAADVLARYRMTFTLSARI